MKWLRQLFVNWLLQDLHLPMIRTGTNSVIIGDKLTFTDGITLDTDGDFGLSSSSGRFGFYLGGIEQPAATWADLDPATCKWFMVSADPAWGLQDIGCTMSETGTGSNAMDSVGSFRAYATNASIGATGGVIASTFAWCRRPHRPRIHFRIRTGSDITSVRYWIGWVSGNPGNTDAGASHHLCLNASSVAGDTNWYISSKDGTTQSRTSSGVAWAASTEYVGYIRLSEDTATAYISINGSAEVSHTSNLPGNSTDMSFCGRLFAVAASSRIMDIHSFYGVVGR